mgnify:CR=1 FL=1
MRSFNSKAVLFDLDGTLVDSLPLILKTFQATMHQMDLHFNHEEVLSTVGLPLHDICNHLAGSRGKELFNRYLEYQDAIHDDYLGEYQGTTEMLKSLKEKGYRLGIVTSKRHVMAERGIKLTGLDNFIETLVALEDAPRAKPEAEPVLKALDNIHATPKDAVYVGDSPFDIQCGKKAGVKTIGVTWGISSMAKLQKEAPNTIIDNWQQLLSFLEKE